MNSLSHITQDANQSWVKIGQIIGVFGIKGAIKIKTFTESPSDISSFSTLFDQQNNQYHIEFLHTKDNIVYAYISINKATVCSKNDAMLLRGKILQVPRSSLPELEGENFYHVDIIGCRVFYEEKSEQYGLVNGVYNFGASDIIEIVDANGKFLEYYPLSKELIIEFNKNLKHLKLIQLTKI